MPLQKLKDYFFENTNFKSAILFGSFAKGTQNNLSDLDIGILSKDKLTAELKLQTMSELTLKFHKSIDLIDLNDIHIPLLQEILVSGIWLKSESNSLKE